MFAMGLAEWIIDDTCILSYIIRGQLSILPLACCYICYILNVLLQVDMDEIFF